MSRPAVKLDTALEVAAYEAAVKALHDQLASGFGEPFKDADYPDHYRVPGARVMADKATLDAIADALASG